MSACATPSASSSRVHQDVRRRENLAGAEIDGLYPPQFLDPASAVIRPASRST